MSGQSEEHLLPWLSHQAPWMPPLWMTLFWNDLKCKYRKENWIWDQITSAIQFGLFSYVTTHYVLMIDDSHILSKGETNFPSVLKWFLIDPNNLTVGKSSTNEHQENQSNKKLMPRSSTFSNPFKLSLMTRLLKIFDVVIMLVQSAKLFSNICPPSKIFDFLFDYVHENFI